MSEKYEKLIKNTNSMKEIREVAESNPTLKDELIKSIQEPISLVCEVFERQSLKGVLFKTFDTAMDEDIKQCWENIYILDDTMTYNNYEMKNLNQQESSLAGPSQSYQEHEGDENDNAQIGPSATPVCNNCAGTNSPTKHCGKQSFNKLKKIRT
ncbi:9925_t:CDS:2 [Gigaspora rosea]|nr:9925_t:CDS:2 [Gigaspora rosea]